MDNNIRNLIHIASEENNSEALNEAYEKLKSERQTPSDKSDAVLPDLFVLCAETALKLGQIEMTEDCIKMFFMKTPPSNQFLCRAYLCQAQLNAPNTSKKPEQLDKAVEFLLKAINFSKKNPRYFFLVYNASVLYWQFCRPFLKPNYRQFLARSLHQVVKALDDIDDKDYDWRAQLMIALIECHVDAGRKEDAVQVSNATLSFTKNYVPSLYTTVLGLQVRHRLIDIFKVSREIKASNELHIFYKLQRLRAIIEAGEKVDVPQELGKLYKLIVKGTSELDRSSTEMSTSTITTPTVLSKTMSPLTSGTSDKAPLLVDLTRLCLEHDVHELAADCLEILRAPQCIKDPSTSFEIEFMKFDLMVKSLGDKKEMYSKNVVETRTQAIKKLEQYLITAVRLGNPNVIQAGCVTLWNLSLPLLQPNLRHHVRKPLTLVAQSLEDIDSLLVLLRCQVHMELAKCEEDEDQLEYALTHLQKALDMDDSGQYRDRLNTALTRLKLRATLYKTPERPEDLAAMIIEQAHSSNDSSTVRMKRASLVKAGEALSPDAFMQVLDSESDTKDPSSNKGPPSLLNQLAGKANQFQKAVSKAEGHLKRLGQENGQERVRIWADLAKTARKQQVWDVTRVAARFCLLYDNGRWSRRGTSGLSNAQSDDDGGDGNRSPPPDKRSGGDTNKLDPTGMKALHPQGITPFKKEQDVLRTLGEVHFIYAEALVHLLRGEDIQLGDNPIPPEDTVKLRPKRYEEQQVNIEELPEWVTYRNWISSLSKEAISSFQRAADLGTELREPWLICNSAVYLWNYTNHMLTQGRFKEIVPIYTPVLEGMKATGHAGETVLLCQICNAMAQGLMQPWIPNLSVPIIPVTPSKEKPDKPTDKAAKGRQSGKGTKAGQSKTNIQTVTIDPEGITDLKKALDVLEFIMTTTNGTDPKNLVPVAVKHPLIKNWVFCKQLLNQPIPKNLGHDDENPHSQGPMSKALCAVEMISLQGNGLPEIPQCPTLPEVVKMVESSVWSDRLVELEMWSRLAVLAYNQENHQLVMQCGEKAMVFADSEQSLTKKQPRKIDSVYKHKVVVEQEMLYYASVAMGQSLIKNMQGRNEIRRDALICFVNACRFGQQANNYDLVITAARHYWNAIKPFIGEPIERELLKDPLEAVLGCIAAVAGKDTGKDDEDEEDEADAAITKKDTKSKPVKAGKAKKDKEKKSKDKVDDKKKDKGKLVKSPSKTERTDSKEMKAKPGEEDKPASIPSAYDEDLMMRAAMYGVLFTAYADERDWEQGLRAMDQAVKDMPRTHHRLLIFKHRVITNAKLGRNVVFDMGKFKNESDDVISTMWRHVALNSKDPLDQLTAYQNAIEVLEDPESDWQKVDYLLEFGEWLFVNEYPASDAIDQFLWAADILFNKSSTRQSSSSPDKDSDVMSESSVDTSKYVPRERKSVIGQCPSEVHIKTEELTDVRQIETLCRIHVMLAQVSGRSSPYYNDYVLLAYGFIHRILQISIHSAEKMIRDGGKPGERAPSKRGKDKSKETQAKPDKAGSKCCLPSSLEGWSIFELPEKLQEYFKCDITGTMICKNTVQKPMLTIHYLNVLLNDLCELGYHQLGLPVVVMTQLIADMILEQEHLQRLVHLKMMQLCQQLNLLSGVSFHEKAVGTVFLTEQDQAQSREEIELWKEKQRQVTIEEERTRASKTVLFETKTSNLDNRSRGSGSDHGNLTRGPGSASTIDQKGRGNQMEYEPLNKYKRVISGVKNREIWTAQAEILVKQGHYQTARQLLYEANISARAFEDHHTLASILVQLAILGLAESNWGQAISLLLEAQKLHGSQKFWLDTTVLLVEACLSKSDRHSLNPNKPDEEAIQKVTTIITEAKSLFQGLAEENTNKASMADYIEAVLEARLGKLMSDYFVNDTRQNKLDDEIIKKCQTACQYLRGAGEKLTQLGYRREAVKVMMKEAAIKRMFADRAQETDQRHQYLMEAYSILNEATNIADAVMSDALSVSSLSEMRSVSLPVQREAVELRLQLTDLMVNMFLHYSREHRARREREARKGSVEKLIDDFVHDEEEADTKEDWEQTCRSLIVDTMMQLSVANGMASGLPHLKAKIVYNLGLCLRALSAHTSPDAEDQWREIHQKPDAERDAANTLTKEEIHEEPRDSNQDNEEDTAPDASASREFLKYTAQALDLKRELMTSRKYMGQAVECLSQAVQIGLKANLRDVVGQACYELVECVGVHDPSTSVQYLALYQSCYMSEYLEGVLYRAQADPALSRQAALLRQRRILSKVEYLTDHSSSMLSANISHLGDHCEAWRRLSIMKAHLELTKEFSVTNMQFIVLQHSPDRQYLYGGILDKGRSAIPSGKPNKQSGSVPVPSKAIITRTKVNCEDLDNLIEEFRHFKNETASELMRRNYTRRQREQQRKMLGRIEENLDSVSATNVMSETNIADQEAHLEAHFHDVVAALEAYLDPIITKLQPALNTESISDTVVLLADDHLLRLPLESLKTFVVPRVTSISRDFSLQFLYHRLHHSEDADSKGDIKKGGAKKGAEKGKPEKPSTAKSRPSDKKGGKESLPSIPKDGPVVDINAVRYVTDLYNECDDEDEPASPVKVMTDLIAKYKTVTSKWAGAMGTDHLPSIGEIQSLLLESSAFLFYGTERCLGALPPYMLAPMNLSDCNIALIMDLVHTSKSFPRQSRDDAAKSMNAIWLENPLECAMLFSLAGVGCVVGNTWHGQFHDIKNKVTKYFTGLLEENKTVGQAVRSLIEFPQDPNHEVDSTSDKGIKHTEGRRNSMVPIRVSLLPISTDPPRHWFNTVVYGIPSVILAQTKAP